MWGLMCGLWYSLFAEMQGNSLGCPEESDNDFGSLVPFC